MAAQPGAERAFRMSLSNLKHHSTEAAWHLCQALQMVLTAALAALLLARKRARRWLNRRALPPKP